MADRALDIVGVVNDLRARMARVEALGAARWGVPTDTALVVAVASSTSNQTGITALADITFATATWVAVTGRLYRITLVCLFNQVTSAGDQAVQIVTGASGAGTVLAQAGQTGATIAATGTPATGSISAYQTGSGSTSVHARATTSGGTLTIANATAKGWFVVEDVGPV